jgi:hypothetical protein
MPIVEIHNAIPCEAAGQAHSHMPIVEIHNAIPCEAALVLH